MKVLCMILIVMFLVCGCQEQIQTVGEQPKVWGKGDPPADWQGYFGNDNMARLNYMQNQTIYRIGQAAAELAGRVRKLEEPLDVNDIDINADAGDIEIKAYDSDN